MRKREASFHCRKAVAPLKPGQRDLDAEAGGEFPLPKGGGPIEAEPYCEALTNHGLFPLPKGGGPIEA